MRRKNYAQSDKKLRSLCVAIRGALPSQKMIKKGDGLEAAMAAPMMVSPGGERVRDERTSRRKAHLIALRHAITCRRAHTLRIHTQAS